MQWSLVDIYFCKIVLHGYDLCCIRNMVLDDGAEHSLISCLVFIQHWTIYNFLPFPEQALKILFSNTGKPLGGVGVEAEAGKGGG